MVKNDGQRAMNHTVFVVDDDQGILKAVRRLLQAHDLPVHCFSSAREFLEAYDPAVDCCLILDLAMPNMNGLELQRELVERHIEIPVIFLSGHGSVNSVVKAMKSGAVDFLEKPFDSDVLISRVRRALEVCAQGRAEREERIRVLECYETLTPREREVMRLVVEGAQSKEVARELNVSKRTIDIHRARIMSKMKADTIAELVNMAVLLEQPASSTEQ